VSPQRGGEAFLPCPSHGPLAFDLELSAQKRGLLLELSKRQRGAPFSLASRGFGLGWRDFNPVPALYGAGAGYIAVSFAEGSAQRYAHMRKPDIPSASAAFLFPIADSCNQHVSQVLITAPKGNRHHISAISGLIPRVPQSEVYLFIAVNALPRVPPGVIRYVQSVPGRPLPPIHYRDSPASSLVVYLRCPLRRIRGGRGRRFGGALITTAMGRCV